MKRQLNKDEPIFMSIQQCHHYSIANSNRNMLRFPNISIFFNSFDKSSYEMTTQISLLR